MSYYVNLENISIGQYKEILESADLIPSQMALKVDIDDIVDIITKQKIETLFVAIQPPP